MWRTHRVFFLFLQSVILSHHRLSAVFHLFWQTHFHQENTYPINTFVRQSFDSHLCAILKKLIETACKTRTKQEPRVQLIYGLCYCCSLVCHHLRHRITSAQYDMQSAAEQRKPGKQQAGGCAPATTQTQ